MMLRRSEAKDEYSYYGEQARRPERLVGIERTLTRMQAQFAGSWADPIRGWLDNLYDAVPQRDAYEHLRPVVKNGSILQIGGTGKEAVKAAIGGAASAVHITPVEEEVELTRKLAHRFGLSAVVTSTVGFGEDLPYEPNTFDAVISEGCLHHMNVDQALREAHRVMRVGARFAAWDPWHARLYNIGTAIFGKREPGIECRPLNLERVKTFRLIFPDSEIRLHGAIVRYLFIVAGKAGVSPTIDTVQRWTDRDDRLARHFNFLARNGSAASLLATRTRPTEAAT